ncbi:MAG: (deoxy)nucleoside triphosphate pyrophosphohydrolase [Myxococcales bacterium]
MSSGADAAKPAAHTAAAPGRRVRVVAALIERDGRLLVARRHDQGARAGLWEFPGGKVEPGEGDAAALQRELREELGVEAGIGALYARVEHRYPEVLVDLVLYKATLGGGSEPRPLAAQEVRWVRRGDLLALPFCEADRPLLAPLAREPG